MTPFSLCFINRSPNSLCVLRCWPNVVAVACVERCSVSHRAQPTPSTASHLLSHHPLTPFPCGVVWCPGRVSSVVYNPIWATPSCLLAYFWKDADFDWRAAYAKWRSREYWTFILPSNLVSVWLVWLPAVSIIYCMPASLQIPLFAIVLCFWSIILSMVTKAAAKDADPAPAAAAKAEVESDGVTLATTITSAEGEDKGREEGDEEEDVELDEDDEEVDLADVEDSTASISR